MRLIQDVFSIIESRFPDALIVSEKGFGNLDELDIDNFAKTSTEGVKAIIEKTIVIVDNNNITYVGDESCIKNSMIVSSLKQSSLMRNAVIFESYSCENEKC